MSVTESGSSHDGQVDSESHQPDHHHHEMEHGWRDPHQAPGPLSILDIGGDIGAVTVMLPEDTPTGELMACRRGRPSEHFHTGVHLREAGGAESWVAVFPSVPEGDYSLLSEDQREYCPFSVTGGEVTSLSLCDGKVTAN